MLNNVQGREKYTIWEKKTNSANIISIITSFLIFLFGLNDHK